MKVKVRMPVKKVGSTFEDEAAQRRREASSNAVD
jgi:hypothetical protein